MGNDVTAREWFFLDVGMVKVALDHFGQERWKQCASIRIQGGWNDGRYTPLGETHLSESWKRLRSHQKDSTISLSQASAHFHDLDHRMIIGS